MKFPGTALLIDDEPHIRKFVSLILKKLGGSRILEASNGQEGVDLYRTERPELVLLDVNMPGMTGLETLRQLREINPDVVAVMLTSLANRQTVDEAIELGAAHYIRKDSTKEEIAAALSETIERCFGDPTEEPSS